MDVGAALGQRLLFSCQNLNKMAAEDGDLEASVSSLDSFAISSITETPAQ